MSKYKIGICGHFGGDNEFYDGQTVKTKTITEELITKLGKNNIKIVDTYGWKKRSVSFFLECALLAKDCENVIIFPAHNGVKILVPLFNCINKIFNRKLYYIVIGGWLPDLIKNNKIVSKNLKSFNRIYVETNIMIEKLKEQGFSNVEYLPNFKRLKTIDDKQLNYKQEKIYKLCTFSRVIKEKGIEDAIKSIENINSAVKENIYTLDIYGPIEESYKKEFEKLESKFPEYIKYKGTIEYGKSVETLKDYYLLLFPTLFKTEGIPGTIIDAYSAGIPVIAARWNSYSDIIDENKTGLTFELGNTEELIEILKIAYKNPKKINDMKLNCLKKAKQYSPESALEILAKEILELNK